MLAQTDPRFQVEADSLDNIPRNVTDCKNVLLGTSICAKTKGVNYTKEREWIKHSLSFTNTCKPAEPVQQHLEG